MIKWEFKDPDEVLDYEVDWSARVGTDSIASADWSVVEPSSGLTIDSSQIVGKTTVVWLSAGNLDVEYEIEFFHCIEINILLLFFVRQRLAQHIHLIFFNIIVNSFLQCLIHNLCNY